MIARHADVSKGVTGGATLPYHRELVSSDSLPRGRLSRLRQMAQVGLRTGMSFVGASDGSKAAVYAAEVLGNLRGLATKVGQMVSYVDGMIPEAHRETFERSLSRLRDATPSSPPEAVRATLEAEWKQPITDAVASFDEAPFASASIGQVHRGRLHDGRDVAIKVQHTGIAEAIESDLANASVLETMVGVAGGSKLESKRIFEEVKTRLREELDYALEAERQTRFAALHAHDPEIVIPAIVPHLSTRRVLVSELHRGDTLENVATRPLEERRAYAETLWRFVFRGNLVGGMFNADPHPGNYLFADEKRIVFLDFGCVEMIPPARLAYARALHRAAIRRDASAFEDNARRVLGTKPGPYEDFALRYSRRCFEPLFGSPFRIDRAYVTELVQGIKEMKSIAFRKDAAFTALPKGMVFMNRLQFGFYSVLARLDVEVDYAALETRFLSDAGLL